MLIRIYKLRKYHQEGPAIDLKHYAVFSVIECFKSVGSIISLVFLAIIILLPWRAYETFQLMKAESTSPISNSE